ncbi:MAG: Fic family protein [Lysobacterales bacterium]
MYIWQQTDWPRLHIQESALAGSIALARHEQGKAIGLIRAIGVPRMDEVTRDIWINEAVATAAIEGEKIDMGSVRSSVMRRLGMHGESGAPASRSVDGLLDVMEDATHAYPDVLSDDRLYRWQSALFPGGASGIRRITVGKYRITREPMQIVSGPVGREKVHYEAPKSSVVAKEMRRLLAWFEQTKPRAVTPSKMDGIVRAAIAHLWFETVHPFEDGNGRVGRAIVDLALAQDAGTSQRIYSMSRQLMRERDAYYRQLSEAQRGTLDVTAWVTWFIAQFCRACIASQEVISGALDKNRFWATHSAHSLNARQRKALTRMLDAGNGGFEGGMSAEKYGHFTGASKATATRDLVDLEHAGLLLVTGQGRATRYWVNVPGWTIGEPDAN